MGLAFVAWLSMPLSIVVNQGRGPLLVVVAAAVPTFVGVVLYLAWLLRCPRCKGNLGQTIAMHVGFSWNRRRINFCPYCAANLDEPVSRGPIAGG